MEKQGENWYFRECRDYLEFALLNDLPWSSPAEKCHEGKLLQSGSAIGARRHDDERTQRAENMDKSEIVGINLLYSER